MLFHKTRNAMARQRTEFLDLTQHQLSMLRAGDDGGRHWMFAPLLQTCRQTKDVDITPGRHKANGNSLGFPSVNVPVLSNTRVSTFPSTSSASAFRTKTPAIAPRPVPTMIDIGVASPNAQGQAMINTATALTSA